jgi:biotin-(acetyl-CoA carboxylase) ligase
VAGSLTTTQVDERGLLAVVLGVGINVESRPRIEPTPFVPGAACLRDYPCAADLTEAALLSAALAAFARLAAAAVSAGPGVLFPEYRRRSAVLGEEVRIYPEGGEDRHPGSPLARGVVEDLRPDLSLVLRGRPEPVDRGRLAFEKDCRALGQ